MVRCCFTGVVAVSCWLGAASTRADEAQDAPAKGAATVTPLQIAQWIKDLDSDEFQTRQEATQKLFAAGKQAAAQVAKAADADNAEVTARCLDILKKLLKSDDAETKASAKAALEGLTKAKNSAVARQAEVVLDPNKQAARPADPFGVPGLPGVAPPVVPGLPRIEIRGAAAGGGMRVSMKSVDGRKTIEAEEGTRKTKIEEDDKGGIKIETTETIDGKEKTSKFEAKNEEELKKNHPEAHKLYTKYARMTGPGAAVVIGGLGPMPALPFPGGLPIRIGPIPQKALDQMEEAKKQLADATEKLRKLAGESRISPEDVKKLADQIESAKKQLEEARAQLPK